MAAKDDGALRWTGQRGFFEIYFAVLLDADRRRAAWVRTTIFQPRVGPGRVTLWAAWFDRASATPARALKELRRIDVIEKGDDPQTFVRMGDASFGARSTAGSATSKDGQIAWSFAWVRGGGPAPKPSLPRWVPAPTHVRVLEDHVSARGTTTIDGRVEELSGTLVAMHLWGRRRVPKLSWIWSPGLDGAGVELTAADATERPRVGIASLALSGTSPVRGRPSVQTTDCGVVAGALRSLREIVHVRAWSEPERMVGYAYRDTDGRNLLVAQSDVASLHVERFTRKAPGIPWRPVVEQRSVGGAAVEIHRRSPVDGVRYIAWDETQLPPEPARETLAPVEASKEHVPWPEAKVIVALGLTYADHGGETGERIDPGTDPIVFMKDLRTLRIGGGPVHVPEGPEITQALEGLEPGIDRVLAARYGFVPAVMDYEGELAVVVLDAIDDASVRDGRTFPVGFAAANDLTARVCQVLGEGTDRRLDYWAVSKSFGGFFPTAPRVWAPPGVTKLPSLRIETRVNGALRQEGHTRDLVYSLRQILGVALRALGRPLGCGDIITTGTPAGVGLRMSPVKRRIATMVRDRFRKVDLLVSSYATPGSRLLRPGDVVDVSAGRAGSVRSRLEL